MNTRVSAESIILSLICLADMLSTLFLVSIHAATEQNPLMAACLRHSPVTFIVIKTLSFLPLVVLLEWYRRRKPAFALAALRFSIVAYLVAYLLLTLKCNTV